jgi:hypothetical protein
LRNGTKLEVSGRSRLLPPGEAKKGDVNQRKHGFSYQKWDLIVTNMDYTFTQLGFNNHKGITPQILGKKKNVIVQQK